MLGRLVHRADFELLLASKPRWRSAHFSLHHVGAASVLASAAASSAGGQELSTSDSLANTESVDNFAPTVALGVLVPKRHARRAVTRNLIRRLARAIFSVNAGELPAGRWLVRLKSPFAPAEFVSAASPSLAAAVRDELERLVALAVRRPAGGSV